MKKLFISCPMKGRTEENIRATVEKMHKLAEVVFDQELELVHCYDTVPAQEVKRMDIWRVGESVKLMSKADYFIGVFSDFFKNCDIERCVAMAYDVPTYFVDMQVVAPDACWMETGNCMSYK